MIYEFHSDSDFQTGATLITKVPESDIDEKALHTLLASPPRFALPFRHRNTDGHVEFTYLIGKNSKLVYMSGQFTPKDYAELWTSALSPLLEYDDWFLNPYSFVLDSEFLYYDRNDKSIKYVYVPSTRRVSDNSSLLKMVDDISDHFRVTDANLENTVLRAIRKDFNPTDFISMLKPYLSISTGAAGIQQSAPAALHIPDSANTPIQTFEKQPSPRNERLAKTEKGDSAPISSPVQDSAVLLKRPGDIFIDIPETGKGKKEREKTKKEKQKAKSSVKDIKTKKTPPPKPVKEKGGLFGVKKKDHPMGMIMGAAAESPMSQPSHAPIPPTGMQPTFEIDETQIECDFQDATGFRLISGSDLPQKIVVQIGMGSKFSIGRFDAAVGARQSDFEFDKNTKAVSRHHCVVERSQTGYSIVDLGSSAGTFINNRRMVPNALHPLNNGDKVSFGSAGADYVWENIM